MYCLPPYTMHIIQPFDVAIFHPLKTHFSRLTQHVKLYASLEKSYQYTLPRYFTPLFRFGEIHSFWACAFSQLILGGKQLFSQWKMAHHCAVTGCSNGDFWLNRWHEDWSKLHNCLNSNPPCSCEPPF